jgi:hypothetical protein
MDIERSSLTRSEGPRLPAPKPNIVAISAAVKNRAANAIIDPTPSTPPTRKT